MENEPIEIRIFANNLTETLLSDEARTDCSDAYRELAVKLIEGHYWNWSQHPNAPEAEIVVDEKSPADPSSGVIVTWYNGNDYERKYWDDSEILPMQLEAYESVYGELLPDDQPIARPC